MAMRRSSRFAVREVPARATTCVYGRRSRPSPAWFRLHRVSGAWERPEGSWVTIEASVLRRRWAATVSAQPLGGARRSGRMLEWDPRCGATTTRTAAALTRSPGRDLQSCRAASRRALSPAISIRSLESLARDCSRLRSSRVLSAASSSRSVCPAERPTKFGIRTLSGESPSQTSSRGGEQVKSIHLI